MAETPRLWERYCREKAVFLPMIFTALAWTRSSSRRADAGAPIQSGLQYSMRDRTKVL